MNKLCQFPQWVWSMSLLHLVGDNQFYLEFEIRTRVDSSSNSYVQDLCQGPSQLEQHIPNVICVHQLSNVQAKHYNHLHTQTLMCLNLIQINFVTIWVFLAFFIKENGSNTNVVQKKVNFVEWCYCGCISQRKSMASVWLTFDFQKVRFSTRYM